jgi:hypothetical protein
LLNLKKEMMTKIFCLLLLALALLSTTQAQSPSRKDKQQAQRTQIKNLVDSQHYVFNAQMALPMAGHSRQLTGDYYDLEVGKTTIISYLPFFGRAYSAPIDPAKGGIQFTSKKFDYTATPKKSGGWNVLIKPKDLQDDWQLSLDITIDGYATLQVNGGNRQPISFTGVIVASKKNPL